MDPLHYQAVVAYRFDLEQVRLRDQDWDHLVIEKVEHEEVEDRVLEVLRVSSALLGIEGQGQLR